MAKDFDYYFSQLRRIEEHRDQQAEKEIRKLYKEILKDIKTFIADEYERYAEDGTLTFEMLRAKSRDARFLEEVEQRLGGVAPEIAKEIKSAAKEIYQIAYDGMVEAVQKAKDTKELKESLKGLQGVSAETVRATVDNPILEIALEKNHKEIIWDIKREIATALTVGDRYDTMARRLTERVNVSYRKAVLISRTENHRVIERGHLDSAKSIDETLQKGSSGMRMTKKWMTMKDGAVRPQKRYKTKKGWKTGKARAGAPDHVKMHGVIVLEDELFDLGGGVTAEAPGQSGVAGHDCNCRCQVLHKLMDDEQFFKATGRHFPDYDRKGQSTGNGGNANPGEAVHEKTIDFNDRDAVLNELDNAKRDFSNLSHEENLTITSDGKVWRVKGEKREVNPWSIQDSGSSLKGSYSYHNHPASVTHNSFSAEDVSFFFATKQAYSKAADDLFEYTMIRTAKTVDIDPEEAYNKFGELYDNDILEMSFYGKIDIDQDGYHEVMKRLSKEYGFTYKRERLNGG